VLHRALLLALPPGASEEGEPPAAERRAGGSEQGAARGARYTAHPEAVRAFAAAVRAAHPRGAPRPLVDSADQLHANMRRCPPARARAPARPARG